MLISGANPRFKLIASTNRPDAEVWLLLSQHEVCRQNVLDDVALHVFRDYSKHGDGHDKGRLITSAHQETVSAMWDFH